MESTEATNFTQEYADKHPDQTNSPGFRRLKSLEELANQLRLADPLSNLVEDEQLGEDHVFHERWDSHNLWTEEEIEERLADHKAGRLEIGHVFAKERVLNQRFVSQFESSCRISTSSLHCRNSWEVSLRDVLS